MNDQTIFIVWWEDGSDWNMDSAWIDESLANQRCEELQEKDETFSREYFIATMEIAGKGFRNE